MTSKASFAFFLSCQLCLWMTGRVTLAEDDFKPMFSGTDLDGWVLTNTPQDTWKLQDGVLHCTGKPIGEIRTAKMYQNFVMELEWRHMVPRGNAGVFVWADDITSRGVPFHRGIEVQVLENAYGNTKSHTTHGDIFPIHGATMTPVNGRGGSRAFPTENRSNPSPQWNHYRIECVDGEVSLAVNGKVVTQGTQCVPRKGYICLESEGGVMQYRNVQIRELPSSDLSENQVAISDRGYRSLYTGLNLNGWSAENDSRWSAKDWVLAYQETTGNESKNDGEGQESGSLRSKEQFDDVSFVVDVRLKDETSNAVIQAGQFFQIDLRDSVIAAHLEKTGRWNRIEAVADEGTHWIEVNGSRVAVRQSNTHSDAGLVLHPTGRVDFCNLYASGIRRHN